MRQIAACFEQLVGLTFLTCERIYLEVPGSVHLHYHPAHSIRLTVKGEMHENGHRNHG